MPLIARHFTERIDKSHWSKHLIHERAFFCPKARHKLIILPIAHVDSAVSNVPRATDDIFAALALKFIQVIAILLNEALFILRRLWHQKRCDAEAIIVGLKEAPLPVTLLETKAIHNSFRNLTAVNADAGHTLLLGI